MFINMISLSLTSVLTDYPSAMVWSAERTHLIALTILLTLYDVYVQLIKTWPLRIAPCHRQIPQNHFKAFIIQFRMPLETFKGIAVTDLLHKWRWLRLEGTIIESCHIILLYRVEEKYASAPKSKIFLRAFWYFPKKSLSLELERGCN